MSGAKKAASGTGIRALRLMIVALVGALVIACGGGGEPSSEGTATSGTPEEIAGRLVSASSLKEAIQTTRQALSLAGIESVGDDGVAAAAPSSGTQALPTEVFFLASEARERRSAFTMTLEEFGQMLADFEWPFLEESTPGEQIAALLREWGLAARSDASSPHSFAPLFIAEMAKRQEPPIDIFQEYDPAQLRLSTLEIVVFATAFRRFGAEEEASSAWRWLPQPRSAKAQVPCTDLKEWLGDQKDWGKVASELAQFGVGQGVGAGIQKGLEAAGLSEGAVKGFDKGMAALDVAMKLAKLAQLYKSTQFSVETVSDNPIHKAASNEAPKYSAFRAKVGIDPKDAAEFERLAKQHEAMSPVARCMGLVGLPDPPDFRELSKDVDKGQITWRIIEGGTTHALISRDTNTWDPTGIGQLRMNLQRTGPQSADATLVVDLTPEKKPRHDGEEKEARVTVRATLDTSQAPGLGTFLSGAMGGAGLVSAIADLATGWFQNYFQPKAYGWVMVEYHEGGGSWVGTVTVKETYEDDWGGWYSRRSGQGTITFQAEGGGRWEATSSGSANDSNPSQGCSRQESWAYSGGGDAVLYIGGSGADPEGSQNADSPTASDDAVPVYVEVDADGSYYLNFDLPLIGEWKRVGTGDPQRCEVYDTTEREIAALGATVEGKGGPQPNQLSGSHTEPIENTDGKEVGELTVTWQLVRQ